MNKTVETFQYGDQEFRLETGQIARQASGAVLASMGETVVLVTVVAARESSGRDFFPLTVDYEERTYAAGRIPGGFFKREGRPSEKAILTCRLIDRPIRPLFPDGFDNEVQIVATVMSVDPEIDPDVVAMVGASAALSISGVPFNGPVGAARVGFIDGNYVLNPSASQLESSALDLVVAGTKGAVLMVESEAKELTEEQMLGAVVFGHDASQAAISAIETLSAKVGAERWDWEAAAQDQELQEKVSALVAADVESAYQIADKTARQDAMTAVRDKAASQLVTEDAETDLADRVKGAVKSIEKATVRGRILSNEPRIDGRDVETVRPISIETSVLPRTHGSALFTRGETQALVVTTLGTGQDEQIIDGLAEDYRQHFMLHYNFPPYSVGEAGRFGFTGRREVGHGKLAWRAVHPLMPEKVDFPYTVRVVSEITESNGSSSMATVCGSSLSMMDAGVPLSSPVAGIAMGLIKEDDGFAVLSDILGDEDHLGDMDFKVAGTEKGITSLQMDIKITSITKEIMEVALDQARDGRLHILDEMAKGLTAAREGVSQHAPRIETISINKDKIRDVIGPGGKMIREICETTGTKVDIDDDGTVKVAAVDANAMQEAIDWIKGITAEPEVGKIYEGKVVKIVDFGAFVNYMGNKDGLVHISELADHRVGKVTDIIQEGDAVKAKLIGIDDRGKVKLSVRMVDQETGEDISDQVKPKGDRARN